MLTPAGGIGAILDPESIVGMEGEDDPNLTLLLLLIPTGIASIAGIAWYRVREYRYLAAHTSFEKQRFESTLGLGRVIWIYASYFALWLPFVFGLMLLIGWGTAEITPPDFDPESMNDEGFEAAAMTGFFVLLGFTFIVLMSVFNRVFLFHRILGAVVRSTGISGEPDFDAILQSTLESPGRGEGLADAFDVGGL